MSPYFSKKYNIKIIIIIHSIKKYKKNYKYIITHILYIYILHFIYKVRLGEMRVWVDSHLVNGVGVGV